MAHVNPATKMIPAALAGVALTLSLSACGSGGVPGGLNLPGVNTSMSVDELKQEALKLTQNAHSRADELAWSSDVSCLATRSSEYRNDPDDVPSKMSVLYRLNDEVGRYLVEQPGMVPIMTRITSHDSAESAKVNAILDKEINVNSVAELTQSYCNVSKAIRATF